MNYNTYRSLFLAWAIQPTNLVKGFSMSDDDRVLSLQPDAQYPLLELDTPSITPDAPYGSKHTKRYAASCSITNAVATDDWAGQDEVLDDLEPEIEKLIAYLLHQRDNAGPWLRELTIGEVFPIKRFETDNKWGWGFQFTIEMKADFCHRVADHAFLHLHPVWTDGKSILSLNVLGSLKSVDWTEQGQVSRAITSLKTALDLISGITVWAYLDSLIILHDTASSPLTVTFQSDSHTWTALGPDGDVDTTPA